ncbi:UNKNOWN [Stylonychia lemnae]|uniref:Uncharacterized protein n=1 Tax=Stylonychia lemnae TaxID=5949 RepID=A0A078AZL8_STYLE|nr:UNKNOWN [Stylonychia lemnae]|eukprot:CDW86647.1 UNKNOWN [Stylonychia lemnae]
MSSYLKSLTEYQFLTRSRTQRENISISIARMKLQHLETPADFNPLKFFPEQSQIIVQPKLDLLQPSSNSRNSNQSSELSDLLIVSPALRSESCDRKKVKDRLMGLKSPKINQQEIALNYLQQIGKQIKQSYKSALNKKKVLCLSPQIQSQKKQQYFDQQYCLSEQKSALCHGDNISQNLSYDGDLLESSFFSNNGQDIKVVQTTSSILKLQHCGLLNDQQEHLTDLNQSMEDNESQVSQNSAPIRRVKAVNRKINDSISGCSETSSENLQATQSNSPDSQRFSNQPRKSISSKKILPKSAMKALSVKLSELANFKDFEYRKSLDLSDGVFSNTNNYNIFQEQKEDIDYFQSQKQTHNGRTTSFFKSYKQASISPEKQGYVKEQPLEKLIQQQQKGFKGIRENLLNLVKDLDSVQVVNNLNNQSYEKVQSFKIHLKKTTK